MKLLINSTSDYKTYPGCEQDIYTIIYSLLKNILYIVLLTVSYSLNAQNDSSEFVQYRYENGTISSEGTLVDGVPDGYWKSYYPTGILKAEGNRDSTLLDGAWKFYNEDGSLQSIINYRNGLKNGLRERWVDSARIAEEPFVNDRQNGLSRYFYPNGTLKRQVPYLEGRQEGRGFHFGEDSVANAILTFRSGVLTNEQEINRRNRLGLKQGVWIEFYPTMVVRVEGTYKDDLKHGFWKYYRRNGNLIRVERWIMGVLQVDDQSTANVEIRREIHANTGELASLGTYQNGIKEGVHQTYDENGNPLGAELYSGGILLAKGQYDERGRKQGPWEYYYEDGTLKAKGSYIDDLRNETWKYYFQDSTLEQVGRYILNEPDGTWRWYFNDGEIRKEQQFVDGLASGLNKEWNDSNQVIVEGEYIDGLKTGIWVYQNHNVRETGDFVQDEREGIWTITWTDIEQTQLQSEWQNGVLNGLYTRYFKNGQVRERGRYNGGQKDGIWEYFAENGARIVTVEYENGEEVKFNGDKLGNARR